jgi:tetrahedral aminopeptidase
MDLFPLLQTLTETPGPSGYEMEIARAVASAWEPFIDSYTIDIVGSLMAIKKGSGHTAAGPESRPRRLLIAAHMDEIALMVKQIVAHPDEKGWGFLRVTNIGGVDIRHLSGQLVTVHGTVNDGRQHGDSRHHGDGRKHGDGRQHGDGRKHGDGRHDLPGVLGALPGSMQPDKRRDKPYNYDELVVDIGLPVTAVREQVSVGDFITFRQPLRQLLNKRVAGKALDNRASLAAVTVCLEYLSQRRHAWDVIAVATAQEETRLLGAFTSAYREMPDAAVALDVTFAKGPGTSDSTAFELDEGPVIGLGPNVHPGMHKALKEAATALEMKAGTDPHAAQSGTDAAGLQIAREGIPTGLISIPLRYMHTMVESVSLNDIERAGRLLGEFIARLDDDFTDKLAAGMMEKD